MGENRPGGKPWGKKGKGTLHTYGVNETYGGVGHGYGSIYGGVMG